MRGARCKALRKKFIKERGKSPMKTTIKHVLGVKVTYFYSEWRRLKQEYKRSRRAA